MPQKSQVKEHLVFQGWVKLVSWLQSDWIPHGVSLKHPQAALASQNITHIKWNIPPDTKKQKRYNQILTDNAKCLQTFSSPRKHAWLIQIGANPQFWQNGERQEFQTSKHQNLPIYHFQKSLSLAIFLIFHVCQREITIYSLFGSPCIMGCGWDGIDCWHWNHYLSKDCKKASCKNVREFHWWNRRYFHKM